MAPPDFGTMHPNSSKDSFTRRLAARFALVAAVVAFAACADQQNGVTIPVDAANAVSLAKAPSSSKNTLNLTISGLPAGTLAGVKVTGPNGFSRTVDASTSLTGLVDGSYLVTATNKVVGSDTYAPSPTSVSISLRRGRTVNTSVTFTKVATTGSLGVTITIGEVTPTPVTVTGPNAYSQAVPSTTTLANLAPGTYTITSPNFTSPSGVNYVAGSTTQTANVTVGTTVNATVTYTGTSVPPSTSLNMQVLGSYIVQSVQTLSNSVALVAGKNGVLRVFAVANQANTVQPTVRARLYNNGALVGTFTANAPTSSVPTALSEATATSSWNIQIPGNLIQPGLSILTDVDPNGAIAESIETDNSYPANGSPLPLAVRVVPNENVRFVPILSGGLTGNVSTVARTDSMLLGAKDIFPLRTVPYSVHATYSTSTAILSDGTGWGTVLSEIDALRSTEGSSDHYYGVIKTNYSSGVVGMGYIGWPASIGWDVMPSAIETMAHEFGHNYGRQHAPCGGPAGPDANFPYAGGIDGVYGWNVRTNSFVDKSTADLMGYCRPRWISDYTYNAVFNYRGYSNTGTAAAVQPGLLVWGQVSASGEITLEPTMRVNARPSLPPRGGAYTLEATDATDNPLFSLSFDPREVGDATNGARSFAYVVPMSDAAHGRLARVRVDGNGRTAERGSRLAATALQNVADRVSFASAGAGRGRLRFAAGATGAEMALVRDAVTGEVLAFARGGDATLANPGREVDVIVSDGVRSVTKRVRPQ